MKLPVNKRALALPSLVLLSFSVVACGGKKPPLAPGMAEVQAKGQMIPDSPIITGQPYNIQDIQYVPSDTANYDAVGYASWYGDERDGQTTANGETFHADWVSAAHKTLPIPSYIEVTSLDTGRTILVRVNDRGPMVNDRLIDLSEGAARLLGITNSGTAAVRVRRVNPPQGERDVLRAGGQAPARLDTPPSLLAALNKKLEGQKGPVQIGSAAGPSVSAAQGTARPTAAPPAAKPSPAPRPSKPAPSPAGASDGGFIIENVGAAKSRPTMTPAATAKPAASRVYYVQIASFSDQARAKSTASKAGAEVDKAGSLYRVRSGPFATETEANQALAKARKAGFGDARVFVEPH